MRLPGWLEPVQRGAVLGLLGIGLPDIPIFLAALLRSLYTQALHFGVDYGKAEEQVFLLELLALSLYNGDDFMERDAEMNRKFTAWPVKMTVRQSVKRISNRLRSKHPAPCPGNCCT